jgi:hypothetical protein
MLAGDDVQLVHALDLAFEGKELILNGFSFFEVEEGFLS